MTPRPAHAVAAAALGAAAAVVLAVPAAAPAASGAGGGAVMVSVLGDSHSSWPDSWFVGSVASGRVPGARLCAFSSHPGKTSVVLRTWVPEATLRGGVVLVQAGTNDLLLAGSSPAQAAHDVGGLASAVAAAGARPILVSVPPSATQGPGLLELNAALEDWAGDEGIGWLDVTTPVTAPDGTWLAGLSDDGIHANSRGGTLMAQAAREQLPALLEGP